MHADYVYWAYIHTLVGLLEIGVVDDGLAVINFVNEHRFASPVHSFHNVVMSQLDDYFVGKRKQFDIPLVFRRGTPFQKNVWEALQSIPYGKTIAYKDLALQIAHPKAVRAVGGANGKNPIPIIVPCHRVIAADGSLGGYSSGLAIKQILLDLEGIRM